MDDYVPDFLAGKDDGASRDEDERAEEAIEAGNAIPTSGFKRQVLKRGIFKAASLQDKLLEK